MVDTYGDRVLAVLGGGVLSWSNIEREGHGHVHSTAEYLRPDLTDPATVGALAGAMREAYRDALIHAAPGDGSWCVYRTVVDNVIGCERLDVLLVDGTWTGIKDDEACAAPIRGATEGEAWLAAWLARPTEQA